MHFSFYSLNSFHPLSSPPPSLRASSHFLHILHVFLLSLLCQAKKTSILNKVRRWMQHSLALCRCLLFLFLSVFSVSVLCSLSFSSHFVFLLQLCTHINTHTPPPHRNTLRPFRKLVCFQQLQSWLFCVELSAPQGAAGKQNNAEQLVIWNASQELMILTLACSDGSSRCLSAPLTILQAIKMRCEDL